VFIALTSLSFCEHFHHDCINGGSDFPDKNVRSTRATGRRLGDLMVEVLNFRYRTILPILCFGFVLGTLICPSYAAKLKDIRVGEYQTHTRIVFEHGDTMPHETLRPLAAGQLSVVFPDTELDLIRKIPIDRSRRLEEIKIWQRQNELSLILTFAFAHFRYELYRIDQPKRLVVDVFHMTPPDTTSLSEPEEKAALAASGSMDERTDAKPPTDKLETAPEDNFQTHSLSQTNPFSAVDRTVGFGKQQSVRQKSDEMSTQLSPTPEPPAPAEAIESERIHAQKREPQRQARATEPPLQPAARPWRLQQYLTIGLVILTLVILVLLLVMLVLKNHWANSISHSKADDFLNRQNERIAALDAQIQQKLKHLDKV
jgi:hypothetical protein